MGASVVLALEPDTSPWHLLLFYADLTTPLLPKGTSEAQALFWSLSPSYKPMGAKRIAPLTKNVMRLHGVDTEVWQARPTHCTGSIMTPN